MSPSRKIVRAEFGEEVSELLKKMKEEDVPGVLVTSSDQPGVHYFADVLDLLFYVIDVSAEAGTDLTKVNMKTLKWQGQCFQRNAAGKLINLSGRDPFKTIPLNAPAFEVTRIFATEIHRLAIADNGKILGIITPTDVAKFVFLRRKELGNSLQMKVKEFANYGLVGAVTVDQPVIKVLKYMKECQLSAVAVLNEYGQIEANFSASDLKVLHEDNFFMVALTLGEYLQKVSPSKVPICCKEMNTLEEILAVLLGSHLHRVFVVDDNGHPIAVVSLTDIMKLWTMKI